jgi:hypothetical protein
VILSYSVDVSPVLWRGPGVSGEYVPQLKLTSKMFKLLKLCILEDTRLEIFSVQVSKCFTLMICNDLLHLVLSVKKWERLLSNFHVAHKRSSGGPTLHYNIETISH